LGLPRDRTATCLTLRSGVASKRRPVAVFASLPRHAASVERETLVSWSSASRGAIAAVRRANTKASKARVWKITGGGTTQLAAGLSPAGNVQGRLGVDARQAVRPCPVRAAASTCAAASAAAMAATAAYRSARAARPVDSSATVRPLCAATSACLRAAPDVRAEASVARACARDHGVIQPLRTSAHAAPARARVITAGATT
jgi:hypothetical protein